jgi:hypothetical protein
LASDDHPNNQQTEGGWLPPVTIGVIAGIDNIGVGLAIASLLFAGPLLSGLGLGVGVVLLAAQRAGGAYPLIGLAWAPVSATPASPPINASLMEMSDKRVEGMLSDEKTVYAYHMMSGHRGRVRATGGRR